MHVGLFDYGWFRPACEEVSIRTTVLPVALGSDGNPYSADLAARIKNSAVVASHVEDGVEVLVDSGAAGMGLLPVVSEPERLELLHERLSIPLVSQIVDPLVTVFQGSDWSVCWQALQSRTWIKAIWDRAQAEELRRFRVPNVIHLPIAAPAGSYDCSPVDPYRQRPVVSFVGGQNTSFFHPSHSPPADRLVAGLLALSARNDSPSTLFYDAYHELFQLAEPVHDDDSLGDILGKATTYFNAKLFYNAALSLRQRDRFVIFLSRNLKDRFELFGQRWDAAYGLPCRPPLPTHGELIRHFRETAVNVNLVNGNAETGLNMRPFEITAAGGFMLCYDQPELRECFEIGVECDSFRSESELLEKIEFYLRNPDRRAKIALAGQQKTLKTHRMSHRLQRLLELAAPLQKRAGLEFSPSTWQSDCQSKAPNVDIILDGGANVGQMAEGFHTAFPKAQIYCFEPVAANFALLVERCRNIRATPVRAALSDRDGRATMHLAAASEAHSLLSYQEGNPCAKWTRVVGQEAVDAIALDSWCDRENVDMGRVDILKLDVQGGELQALFGAKRLLRRVRLVLVEVSFVPLYKDSPLFEEVDAFMTESGFERIALYPSDQPHNWADALYWNIRRA